MFTISWREENRGKQGLLIILEDFTQSKYEVFFPSRLRLYLDLLDYLPLPFYWLTSLPVLDMGVAVPTLGPECPICANSYIRNLEEQSLGGEVPKEIPVRLPCGHIIGRKCIHYLAWHANASTGVVCPFCRANHNHMPIHQEATEDKLAICMWVMLETFLRLQAGQSEFEDMEAVLEWAQDDQLLREDVPEGEKREAIKFTVQFWVEICRR